MQNVKFAILCLFYFILYSIFLYFTLLKTYCRMKIMRRNCRQSGTKKRARGEVTLFWGSTISIIMLKVHKSKVFLAPKIMHCWAGCALQTGDRMGPESCLCLRLVALKRHLLSAKRYKLPKHKMLHAPRTKHHMLRLNLT